MLVLSKWAKAVNTKHWQEGQRESYRCPLSSLLPQKPWLKGEGEAQRLRTAASWIFPGRISETS